MSATKADQQGAVFIQGKRNKLELGAVDACSNQTWCMYILLP
jgi:hypothetical protein